MPKLVPSLVFYFALLFLITFLLPVDSGTNLNTETPNITELSDGEVSSSVWSIGDRISRFLSFFSFSIINPMDMPADIVVILSLFNWALLVLLIYSVAILIRGGGGI